MSNSNELAEVVQSKGNKEPNIEIIEIDLANLSKNQKKALFAVLVSFSLQIIYLFSLGFIKSLIKLVLRPNYSAIADYVIDFVSSFTPYLIVVLIITSLLVSYQILINDKQNMIIASHAFDFTGIGFLSAAILFFISLVSFNGSSSNQAFPTLMEIFLFLCLILFLIELVLLPFYINKLVIPQEGQSNKTNT